MKQKLLSLLALTFCWANSIWADPTGDGSATNPYQITNATDLAWFAQKVNTGTTGACAVLTDNIDLSTVLSQRCLQRRFGP